MKAVAIAKRAGLYGVTGEGTGQTPGRSLEFGQEPLPEPVLPPLAGALVLVAPIEHHCDFKHISTFYGGY